MKRTVFVLLAVLLSTAFARVWYVHPDSSQDSIQPCLNACGAGDTVLVAAGTYRENIDWPNTQGIKLRSESGPDATVIHGDSTGSVVEILVPVDTATVLEGFTITGGYSADYYGGGILVQHASPMIRNNTVTENYAHDGGGIEADWSNSVYIVNNRIIRNHARRLGGGVGVWRGTALIIGNVLQHNLCDTTGGAMVLDHMRGVVQDNLFTQNRSVVWVGGLCCFESTFVTIARNTFTYDSAPQSAGAVYIGFRDSAVFTGNSYRHCWSGHAGAVACSNVDPTFLSDTFTDNASEWGSGTVGCWSGARPRLRHCVLRNNYPDAYGGVFMVEDSSAPVIESCAITDNHGIGVRVTFNAGATVSYCDISGNLAYGVYCDDVADSIDARYNWWGDSTGPFHPDSNPGGRGDTVTSGVRFRPWLTGPIFGIAEELPPAARTTQPSPFPTVLRGVASLPPRTAAVLLDIAGRSVMSLSPGANDIRRLAPGIYFVRTEPSVVRRVVVTR